MHVIRGRNINQIYPAAVEYIRKCGIPEESRNGPVFVAPEPVCAVYERPDEMVLLDPARGANPGFHLMECLWHLGGRSDAAFLNNYVKDFGSRFANGSGHLDGAYGLRWRSHFTDYSDKHDRYPSNFDQLDDVVEKLGKNPKDRRIVIQMWDPSVDNDPSTKDACCNQQLFLRINQGRLDMTVTCRSNDAIWGAMGANCVHFPFLQLYLAGRLGLPVGQFHQVSNNYHAYSDTFKKIGMPRPAILDPYTRGEVAPVPIGEDFSVWDQDLGRFLDWHDRLWAGSEKVVYNPQYKNSWFTETAERMALAFWFHRRERPQEARLEADRISAPDWRTAALLWLDQAALRSAAKSSGPAARPPAGVAEESVEIGDVRPG